MINTDAFEIKFTSKEVSAWGGLSLLKKMMDGMGLQDAIRHWNLPTPGSNRGYGPVQLIEQMMVSIWTGANRFINARWIGIRCTRQPVLKRHRYFVHQR